MVSVPSYTTPSPDLLPVPLNPGDPLASDYDGGDCCECTCVSTEAYTCGAEGLRPFDCIDPSVDCDEDLVEAGTKTTITVSANAYDTRPGADSSDVGCMRDGCKAELTRDGDSTDEESRWSCSPSLVTNKSQCSISFMFEEAQDIVDVEVAFWKADERSRTLEVCCGVGRDAALVVRTSCSGS